MNLEGLGMEDEFEKEFDEPWEDTEEVKYVGYQLKMLDRMFCKQMVRLIRESKYGVTMLGGWILEYLYYKGEEPTYQKDIERKFRTGKSTIAGMMKTLEKNGLIVRKSVEGDARLKQLCLTKAGQEYILTVKRGREQIENRVKNGLSEEELALFFDIVIRMQKNLAEEDG